MQRRTNPSILSTAAAVVAVTLAMPLATAQTAAPATPTEAAFKRADANSDGKLSKDEAARLPAIAAKFDELDKDKDGFLTMAEFTVGFAAPK